MFLLVAALFALRVGRAGSSAALSGLLLALAVQTKQVGLLAVLPFALAAWLEDRRRAAWFTVACLLALGASAAALDQASGGWYRYYVFTLTRQHELVPQGLLAFAVRDLLAPLPLAIAVVIAAAGVARGPHRRALRFHAVAGAGLVAIAAISRMNVGGYYNVAMPAHVLLALLFGIAVSGLSRSRWAAALFAACLVQLALRGYDPRRRASTRADREAGERLVASLRARSGPLLLPSHPYLLPRAGHPGHAHQMAMTHVLLNEERQEIRQRLAGPLRQALGARRYRAVVLDPWFWFRAEVEACYREEGPVFADPRVFWPPTGAPTRPETIHVPGEEGPCEGMPQESPERPPRGAYREPRR